MKYTLADDTPTEVTEVDIADAYPDQGTTGQQMFVQNSGTTDVIFGTTDDDEGLVLAPDDRIDFKYIGQSFWLTAEPTGGEIRIVVVG